MSMFSRITSMLSSLQHGELFVSLLRIELLPHLLDRRGMELFRIQNLFAALSVNKKHIFTAYVTKDTMLNAMHFRLLCRVVHSFHISYRT